MEQKLVKISQAEYEFLKDRSYMLSLLENAGVDNWEGYSFAMEDYWSEDEED